MTLHHFEVGAAILVVAFIAFALAVIGGMFAGDPEGRGTVQASICIGAAIAFAAADAMFILVIAGRMLWRHFAAGSVILLLAMPAFAATPNACEKRQDSLVKLRAELDRIIAENRATFGAVPVHVSHPARSKAKVLEFRHAWSKAHGGLPCPLECQTYVKRGDTFVLYYRCTACDVDHICALACGGADDPKNMRWLDAKTNLKKSDDCTLCKQ